MFDTATLTAIAFPLIGLSAFVLLLRAIDSGDPVDLASMFAHPWELTWPRGVQEEEPQPWKLDRIGQRGPGHGLAQVTPSATGDGDDSADAWDAAA